MAALSGEITIKTAEYRPCYVDGEKALFHRWAEISEPPSWGQSKTVRTVAIVEYESGIVFEVAPTAVRFVAGIMNDYCFDEMDN